MVEDVGVDGQSLGASSASGERCLLLLLWGARFEIIIFILFHQLNQLRPSNKDHRDVKEVEAGLGAAVVTRSNRPHPRQRRRQEDVSGEDVPVKVNAWVLVLLFGLGGHGKADGGKEWSKRLKIAAAASKDLKAERRSAVKGDRRAGHPVDHPVVVGVRPAGHIAHDVLLGEAETVSALFELQLGLIDARCR